MSARTDELRGNRILDALPPSERERLLAEVTPLSLEIKTGGCLRVLRRDQEGARRRHPARGHPQGRGSHDLSAQIER